MEMSSFFPYICVIVWLGVEFSSEYWKHFLISSLLLAIDKFCHIGYRSTPVTQFTRRLRQEHHESQGSPRHRESLLTLFLLVTAAEAEWCVYQISPCLDFMAEKRRNGASCPVCTNPVPHLFTKGSDDISACQSWDRKDRKLVYSQSSIADATY